MRVLLSGGGTGGHIFPALAVAKELQRKDPEIKILFVGAKGKMEMTKVPKAGYDIEGLWISGLDRQRMSRNILFPAKLLHSMYSAYRIIKRFRPDVAAGFGGYASGASIWCASKLGVPTLIQEQNAYPGITNKLLGKHVDKICLGEPAAARFFPKSKIINTGNPVRQVLCQQQDKEKAKASLQLTSYKQVVLILGGSLGARTINQMMDANRSLIAQMSDVHFLWQCGSLYHKKYKKCPTAQLPNVTLQEFIYDMELYYAASDVVLSRAGALSIAELKCQAKATIFVPSPNVAEDHQTKNAMTLVNQDAALMVTDQATVSDGIATVKLLLSQTERIRTLEKNIGSMAQPSASQHIADEIINLV